MPRLEAVLLDFDGTIVDTTELIYESMRHATGEVLGHELPREMLMANVGQPLPRQMEILSDGRPEKAQELLESYREELRYLFIVSQVSLTLLEDEAGEDIRVTVERAAGGKCERCWNYSTRVGEFARYPTVCERCVEALAEIEAGGGLPS